MFLRHHKYKMLQIVQRPPTSSHAPRAKQAIAKQSMVHNPPKHLTTHTNPAGHPKTKQQKERDKLQLQHSVMLVALLLWYERAV